MTKHDKQAEAFHEANPHVAEKIVQLCMALRGKGHVRYSIKGLFEVLRFRYSLQTTSTDQFKLNNNMTSWYARKIMSENRSLHGFFETRIRRS